MLVYAPAFPVALAGRPGAAAARRFLEFRDHVFGEHLQVADLRFQRLGVGSLDIRDAEADDDVRDAFVLEPLDAIQGVGVGRDDVDLERTRLALFFAVLLELGDEPVELRRVAATVHPAVGTSGAPQRRVGVAADEDRDRLGETGVILVLGMS